MPNLTVAEPGLSTLVRERTMNAHRTAETRPFIRDLMSGALSIEAFTAYTAQLAYVYRALEAPDRPSAGLAILDRRLDRSGSLSADLAALGVPDLHEHPASTATRAYVQRLDAVAGDLPRYLAHHYTRYLGDLSGGQAIARLVARHYAATPDQLSFYRFEGLEAVPFKRHYRIQLDALRFDAAQVDAFLTESELAFELNAVMFDELGERHGVTI